MVFNYFNPVEVINTDNWLEELQSKKEQLNISSPLFITSPGNRKRFNLDAHFPPESFFDDVEKNPDFDICANAVKFCCNKIFDGVLAMGGGSVMDLAKVVMAHLCLDKSDIHELIAYKEDYPKTLPSIFLPTTHGTASEVTMWGTVWNFKERKKYSISHPDLYPSIAILDGNLTLTLPLDISIITVMDALSHSFESIWNKNSNPTSTDLAIKAICCILKNVEALKDNPSDLQTRCKLLYAANIAGLAFSNTKTAAAHSISYPLTIHHGIPHGVASSISLIPLLEINAHSIQDSLDTIYEKNEISFEELISSIKKIPANHIKYNLRNWGVKKSQIGWTAKNSFRSDRVYNNIVDLTEEDVKRILNDIY